MSGVLPIGDIEGWLWRTIIIEFRAAEGLLGAYAPRPSGRPTGDQLRQTAKLSNPSCLRRGFELIAPSGFALPDFLRPFCGDLPAEGLLGAYAPRPRWRSARPAGDRRHCVASSNPMLCPSGVRI